MSARGKLGGLLAKGAVRMTLAILFVVTVQFGLATLVELEPPAPKVRHRTWPKVYLFPVDEDAATPVQTELLDWLDLLDPTILSLPSERRGFSRVRRGEFVRPLMTPAAWELTVAQADMPTVKDQPLTGVETEFLARVAALASTAPPELPPRARYRAPTFEPGVYWVDAAGELMAESPIVELESMPESATVSGPTRLCAVLAGRYVRAKVTESCGDRRLDMQALAALQRWLGPDPARVPAPVRSKDGLVTVAVQWRWLPGVTLVQPEMERSIWQGEDWRAFNWR